jgi:hypothetical protein
VGAMRKKKNNEARSPLLRIRNNFVGRNRNEDIGEELYINKINKRTVKIYAVV